MNDKTSVLPWYRHPWPWILMAGPAVVVVAGIITLWLAIRSNDGLVTDDYYKQGLAINQITARDQKARDLGLRADVMSGAGGREIRVMLRGKADMALPDALVLRLIHPTRSGVDQTVRLTSQATGVYAGMLEQAPGGRWRVSLEDERREWRLTGEWAADKAPVLQLP